MTSMTSQDTTLETTTAALLAAEEALRAARRDQSTAITAAYLAGESVDRIAERTGRHPTDIRNLLTATGTRRRK